MSTLILLIFPALDLIAFFVTKWLGGSLPTFWVIGTSQSNWKSGLEPLAFIGFVFSGSIYSTWCYNDNRRSILATILLHAAGYLSSAVFAMTGPAKHVFTVLLTRSAIAIAVAWSLSSQKHKQLIPN